MKRTIAILLVILTMTAAFTGCGSTDRNTGSGMNSSSTESTRPNNNTSGSTSSNGTNDTPANDTGAGAPSSNENGMITEEHSVDSGENNNALEEFGDDMRDMADDAGNAVQDAIDGRNRTNAHSGTGMTGGR